MSDERTPLEKAVDYIKDLEVEVERLSSAPLSFGTVLRVLDESRALIAAGSGVSVVNLPPKEEKKGQPKIKGVKLAPGQTVLVNMAAAIVEALETPLPGPEATVNRVFEGDQMEIGGIGGSGALVFKGVVEGTVKAGDTVLLDRTGSVALRIIPKDRSSFVVETDTGVGWDDVGGQGEAKAALREAVEGPIKNARFYKAYGKKALKGVLLFGPPGCGKTLLAKATAAAIREAHGAGESGSGFIYVKGPEVLNMWVGNTEATIRSLFGRAKEHKEEHGYPAVIFIDEADAILGRRGSHHASVLSSTVVPTFLAEMDGMGDSGAFVLLATNRQDTLDPAVVREGRIDRKVKVGRPGLAEAAEILGIHLGRTRTKGEVAELAGQTAANLYSEAHKLYNVALKNKGVKPFYVKQLASGALLAGIVEQATSLAIARDAEKDRLSGVTQEDLGEAVLRVVKANRSLNHDEDLLLFADEHGAEIDAVQPIAA